MAAAMWDWGKGLFVSIWEGIRGRLGGYDSW